MKRPSPLMTFILASAMIHVGLIMAKNSINITLPSSNGSVMAVKIKETNQSTYTSVKKKNSSGKSEKQKTAEIKEKTKQFQSSKSISKKSKAHVITILTEEFSQHFSYPKLAKKHNWQGKVLLSLRISVRGTIENIQIDNSSGYNILDQAAVKSMRKVKSLPQISSWFKNDIELKLPVIYQLTEG